MSGRGTVMGAAAGIWAAAVLLLALAEAGPARAACTYTPLTSGVSQLTSIDPEFFQFSQSSPYWSAAAIRPVAGEDWDIMLWASTAPEPACVTNILTESAASGSGVDFVIGDFNQNPAGTYYLEAARWSGVSQAVLEWDDGPDRLTVDGAPTTVTMGPGNVIQVWDVYLTAGTQYAFHFDRWGGADLKMFVFQNLDGALWTNRAGAVLWSDHCTGLTPAVSGWHAVVVVNDDGGIGSCELGVSSGLCTCPYPMQSGVALGVSPPAVRSSFVQQEPFWTAVGLRSDPSADFDLFVYLDGPGGAPPQCFGSGAVASTEGFGVVDVVVGDFNANAFGPCFVFAAYWSGSGGAKLEWDDGRDILFPNDPPAVRSTGPDDVLEIWDVYLQAGHNYAFSVAVAGPEMELLLFRNQSGGTYWGERSQAVLSTTAYGNYVAPATGYYGLVAVNRNGGSGSYEVRVEECEVIRPLTSGVSTIIEGGEDYFSFIQSTNYWTAIGWRHPHEDFHFQIFEDQAQTPAPNCLANGWAGAPCIGVRADYLALDFNHVALGDEFAWFYQRSWNVAVGGGTVEWDGGSDLLTLGAPAVHRETGLADLLECWDLQLADGSAYDVSFQAVGASARVEIFHSMPGSYGIPRCAAIASFAPPGGQFTAPGSDWYGVVVVNEDGGTGSYDLRVSPHNTGVEEGPPAATGLTAVRPNPARGALRLEYGMSAAGRVGFEALDMAGRVVWRQAAEARPPGRWSLEWRGEDGSGRRLAPGLYFVHMTVDGQSVSRRKVTLLE